MNLKSIYNERYSSENRTLWSGSDEKQSEHIVSLIEKAIKIQFNIRLKNCNVLDIGCGFGTITNVFQQKSQSASGIDISDVAIELAQKNYPDCVFEVMDAFNPTFTSKFDIIFCKGFSGYNTHKATSVVNFINTYSDLLNKNGLFVLVYATDFTGVELKEEMANWTKNELSSIIDSVGYSKSTKPYFFYDYKKKAPKFLLKIFKGFLKKSQNFFVIFQK